MTSKLADIFTLTIDGTEVFFLVVLLVAVFLLMPLFKEMMAAFLPSLCVENPSWRLAQVARRSR